MLTLTSSWICLFRSYNDDKAATGSQTRLMRDDGTRDLPLAVTRLTELRLVLLERREREQPGLPLPARLAILLLPLVQNLLARDGCPRQKPLQQQQRPRLLPGESGSDLLLAGAPFTHLCFLPYSGHPTGWCGGWPWGRWVLLPATYQDEVSGSRFGLS
ncbi:hypothetical protein B296_00023516 [Ensete ventricosum]|uniref:Uncharacterized protein n=1 Tax=Ensete ventricosum TaxID=4639 RepID=A0A426Z8D9_ENSVE|nr:hypothetical protein B296_00023516 [Ensete ventricosum]